MKNKGNRRLTLLFLTLAIWSAAACFTPVPAAGAETPAVTSLDNWQLMLVNPWNKISKDYTVELTKVQNGHTVDSRIASDLRKMISDCQAEGLNPLICSSYRTIEKQQSLYINKVLRLVKSGVLPRAAIREAGTVVAVPGYSEHHTGLAVDIVDYANQNLNESQEATAVQQWLLENSWKYGFVLRYPNGKSDLTGIIYEPWHYRYAGKDAAKEMNERDLCLEEYLFDLCQIKAKSFSALPKEIRSMYSFSKLEYR